MSAATTYNDCALRPLRAADLPAVAQDCVTAGMRFQMAWHDWVEGQCVVRYLISQGNRVPFLLLEIRGEETLPSLAAIVPLLGWYEREMQDLGGLTFTDHPEPFPLVIHEGFSLPRPPLGRAGAEGRLSGEYMPPTMPEVQGDQVQDLYWGPIRADVVETGEFHYSYIGEAILHYHPRLFFKHRGLEARFVGQQADAAVFLAERVSGVGSVCHALTYCQAVEAAWGIEVPPRAQLLRVILAELERLYNHFHYFGLLAKTTDRKSVV